MESLESSKHGNPTKAPREEKPAADPGAGAFGSLEAMLRLTLARIWKAEAEQVGVMRYAMGLLNVEKRWNQYDAAEILDMSRQRVWHAIDAISGRLFSQPRPRAVADVVERARALFGENGGELAAEALARGVDEAFGWTGTTAFSVRRLLGYCGVPVVDLPNGRGLGWNEDGRFNGIGTEEGDPARQPSPESPSAMLRRRRGEALRTILEEAGPIGLEAEEIVRKCMRNFPAVEIGKGSLQRMIDAKADLDGRGTRIVPYERGRRGGGQTRLSLNSFFLGEDEVAVLKEAAAAIRKHMEGTGLGVLSSWKAWNAFHERLPVALPPLGFYMMLRDIGAGGLVYQDYPRVYYPGVRVPEKAVWWEMYEYCALCGRTEARTDELRAFLVDSVGMDPDLANSALFGPQAMGVERKGPGRDAPFAVRPPDPAARPPDLFLPAIDGYRDFSLARPAVPSGVHPSEIGADGRALTHGAYVKLFLDRLERSGYAFPEDERAGLEDERWCRANLGIDRAAFLPAGDRDRPDRYGYWKHPFRFGDRRWFVSDGWGPRSKAPFDAWASRVAAAAGIPFEPYPV